MVDPTDRLQPPTGLTFGDYIKFCLNNKIRDPKYLKHDIWDLDTLSEILNVTPRSIYNWTENNNRTRYFRELSQVFFGDKNDEKTDWKSSFRNSFENTKYKSEEEKIKNSDTDNNPAAQEGDTAQTTEKAHDGVETETGSSSASSDAYDIPLRLKYLSRISSDTAILLASGVSVCLGIVHGVWFLHLVAENYIDIANANPGVFGLRLLGYNIASLAFDVWPVIDLLLSAAGFWVGLRTAQMIGQFRRWGFLYYFVTFVAAIIWFADIPRDPSVTRYTVLFNLAALCVSMIGMYLYKKLKP